MEKYTINLFMWEYQQYMQLSLQFSAESLFEKLDPLLEPQVFLIGILTADRENQHPICVEPEDCGYSVDCFSNINWTFAKLCFTL